MKFKGFILVLIYLVFTRYVPDLDPPVNCDKNNVILISTTTLFNVSRPHKHMDMAYIHLYYTIRYRYASYHMVGTSYRVRSAKQNLRTDPGYVCLNKTTWVL